MAREWKDVRAEMARAGLSDSALARHFGEHRTFINAQLNGDKKEHRPRLSTPDWEVWMDAIKACEAGIPTG
jgi:hypothetical protein